MEPGERVWQAIKIRDLLEEPNISSDERFRLLLDLGIIHESNGSPHDAVLSFKKAASTPVLTADNLDTKGQILAAINRHEEAICSYDKA
jgi:hypothetical protein